MTNQAHSPAEPSYEGGYRVRYRQKWEGAEWQTLSDVYNTYPRACTIASALENRGFSTEIVNVDFDYVGPKGLEPTP